MEPKRPADFVLKEKYSKVPISRKALCEGRPPVRFAFCAQCISKENMLYFGLWKNAVHGVQDFSPTFRTVVMKGRMVRRKSAADFDDQGRGEKQW